VLYLCETSSEHPLAKAIVRRVLSEHAGAQTDDKYALKKFKNINGEGVVADLVIKSDGALPEETVPGADGNVIDTAGEKSTGLRVLCGNDKLMDRFNIDLDFNSFRMNMESLEQEGKTVVCLAIDKTPRLLISLEEAHVAKAEALGVVTYLRDVMKMKVAMITGDNEHAAMKVARYLDIPTSNVTFKAYPNDKKRAVKRFQAAGEKVMFIGDGVNDSPVLA
jgi:P-type Cu+ transporter